MGRPIVDLTGKRFGRLLVLEQSGKTAAGNIRWLCSCNCGNTTLFASGDLRKGTIVSCGCYRHEILIRGSKPTPIEQRFWKHVQKTDTCWIWISAINEGKGNFIGTGVFGAWAERTTKRAHRVSWEIHNGPIPVGLNVCHHCDNPICVRPDHLFLGTQLDNIRDAINKGRMCYVGCPGEKNNHAKLTVEQVIEIRRRAKTEPQNRLAKEFRVGAAQISNIVRMSSWKHVGGGV
jgi:hypothetical protein